MRKFDLNNLNDGIDLGDGFHATVVRSVRTANGIRLTLDVADVDATNASEVDASQVQRGAVRTTGHVDPDASNDGVAPALDDEPTSDEDAARDADQNAPGASPEDPR